MEYLSFSKAENLSLLEHNSYFYFLFGEQYYIGLGLS